MQEPTHILAGALIQRSFEPVRPRALRLALTAVIAFLSHGLLDRLANITYHPPDANFNSVFWICFHLGVLKWTIVFLIIWWRRYGWGIFFAALPDLDWVFIHGQNIIGIQIPFYRVPHLHHFLHIIFDETWPFSLLRVPSNRQHPWACLFELALIFAMLAVFFRIGRRRAQP
jgi:hypothetical protein